MHLFVAAFFLCGLMTFQIQAAPGDLDTNFGTGGQVFTQISQYTTIRVQIQPDGKIVTISSDYWDDVDSFISRHNADGTVDTTFGAGGYVQLDYIVLFDFAIQPDGKLLGVGETRLGGETFAILRLNSNGTRDTGFGPNGVVTPPFNYSPRTAGTGVALQPEGKIVATGFADSTQGLRSLLVRYQPDGTFDTSFGTNGTVVETVSGLASEKILVQSDGKLIVPGWLFISRYNANGILDDSFGTNGKVSTGYNDEIALQADGKILVTLSGTIKRLNPNGTPDTSFGTSGAVSNSFGISAIAIDDNGKILTAGHRDGTFAMSRYSPNGMIDTTFGTNGLVITPLGNNSAYNGIYDLTLQPDGKIVAAGFFGVAFIQVMSL